MSDADRIEEFVKSGSEAAFHSLVQQHLDMVYGTAQRRLGNSGLAEEVAQNVFILLAKKAGQLRGRQDLSGWLYKTTLLKIREITREELRRRQRENESVLLGLSMKEDDSLLKSMIGTLDEALMDLHDKDRQALLLRYIEDKSLREVGMGMGIKEDAAQKRVAKALELLDRAFRKRGYAPAGTVTTLAVLQAACSKAPAGLLASISTVAVQQASTIALTGFGLFLSQLMNLTKLKTTLVCIGLAATPIAYQWNALGKARSEYANLNLQWDANRHEFQKLETEQQSLQKELNATQTASDQLRDAIAHRQVAVQTTGDDENSYRWSEESEYVRVPKSILNKVILAEENDVSMAGSEILMGKPHPVVSPDGTVSSVFLRSLHISPEQSSSLNQCLTKSMAEFQKLAQKHSYLTNSSPFYTAESKTVMTEPFPEEGKALEQRLHEEINRILSSDLAAVFWTQANKDITFHFNDFGRAERRTQMAYDTRYQDTNFYLSAHIYEANPGEDEKPPELDASNPPDINEIQQAGGITNWMQLNYGVKGPRIEETRQDRLKPELFPAQLRNWWPQAFSATNNPIGNQP